MIFARTGEVCKGFYVLGKTENPIYLLDGKRPVLFEAGMAMYGPLYEAALRRALGKRSPAIVFISHVHFDHCGAASYLKRVFPGLQIATSQGSANIMRRHNAVRLMRKLSEEASKSLRDPQQTGISEEPFEPFETDIVVQDAQTINLEDGLSVMALHTPGHTRDLMSYFIPERKILIAVEAGGCSYANGYICTESLVDFGQYMNSIRRLRRLEAEVLCQGHHFVYIGREEVKEFFDRSIQTALDFRSMVERLWEEEKGNMRRVMSRIKEFEYDHLAIKDQPEQAYMINLEARIRCVLGSKREVAE